MNFTHPGKLIEEMFSDIWKSSPLPERIKLIVNGERITEEIAEELGEMTYYPKKTWLLLQKRYDERS